MKAMPCAAVVPITVNAWWHCAASHLSLALPAAMLALLPQTAWSQKNLESLQAPSTAQTLSARGQPGQWQGSWEVTREHPHIRTRAGALALRLDIEQHGRNAAPRVRWTADRALCESPVAPPCDWVGNRGVAHSARVVDGHLLVVLPVSADEADPMVLWLERPHQGRSSTGTLINARGGLAYTVQAQQP